jgi:hypothetical protein
MFLPSPVLETVGNTVRESINDVRDGNVGQDRTPLEVRSPVARRAIDVLSVDGVRNTVRSPVTRQAINVSSIAGDGNTIRESISDVRDGNVGQDRTSTGVRSPVARRAINVSSLAGVRNAYREGALHFVEYLDHC